MKKRVLILSKNQIKKNVIESFEVKVLHSIETVKNNFDYCFYELSFLEKDKEKFDNFALGRKIILINKSMNPPRSCHNCIEYSEEISLKLLNEYIINYESMPNSSEDFYSVLLENKSVIKDIDNIIKRVNLFFNAEYNNNRFYINLIIRELLTNAMRHGNENDESKMVLFHMFLKPKDREIKIFVKDEGKGFDLNKTISKIKEKDDLRNGQRGLFIIDKFAKKIYTENNKICVEIKF